MVPVPAIRDFAFTDGGAECVLACIQESVEVASFQVEVMQDGVWFYRTRAWCGPTSWQTGWIELSYLGRRKVESSTEALSKSIALAVYFATHDFDTKLRNKASSDSEARWDEPYRCAPQENFALACARALSDWLIWEVPDAAVNTAPHFNKGLPPRPKPNGSAFKAPYTVSAAVREDIRVAVEAEKISAGG
jgi:hypothetical protein